MGRPNRGGKPRATRDGGDATTSRFGKSMRKTAALRHDQKCRAYNRHFRQLLHVGFKVAAEMGATYSRALEHHAAVIGRLVTENLLEKHIKPVFVQP